MLSIAADGALGTAPGTSSSAAITLNGGGLQVTTVSPTSVSTISTNRGITLGTSGGTIQVTAVSSGTINTNETALQYQGVIGGPGSLTVMGGSGVNSGTNPYILELGGASNSYGAGSGTTTINNAIVAFQDNGGTGPNNILPASTVLSLVNSGWFNFNNGASSQTIAGLSGDATGKVSTTNASSLDVLTINPAANQSYTFLGVIGAQTILSKPGANGELSVVIGGAGTEVLAGVNTYTGSTTVTGGTLQVGNGAAGSLATAGITLSNNTLLAYNIGTAQTFSGPIVGGGAVSVKGGAELWLSSANSKYSGGLTVTAGTLGLGGYDAGNENVAGSARDRSPSAPMARFSSGVSRRSPPTP